MFPLFVVVLAIRFINKLRLPPSISIERIFDILTSYLSDPYITDHHLFLVILERLTKQVFELTANISALIMWETVRISFNDLISRLHDKRLSFKYCHKEYHIRSS